MYKLYNVNDFFPGKYECGQCGKVFRRPGRFETHIRAHAGEKPYECVQCDKRFKSSCHLTKHKKTHILEKP